MPQREFWATQHPTEIAWRYRAEPMDPNGPSFLTVTVYDQAGKMMEHAAASMPGQLVHEAVATALVESWEGYLFGERHAAPRALQLAAQRFRAQARRLGLTIVT